MAEFPYREAFHALERSILEIGSKIRPESEIRKNLSWFKTFEGRTFTDDEYYDILVGVVFYSGFRATTVEAKMPAIRRWFGDFRKAAQYGKAEIQELLADPEMIGNRKKIIACVENARATANVVKKFGSFQHYIYSFDPKSTDANLNRLARDARDRFSYLGEVTVLHFLTDIGMPVLKPDLVICRTFKRLGLIESEDDLRGAVEQGRRFAAATGEPIRYIDIVFVSYGQMSYPDFGLEKGICLKNPRCEMCGIREYCTFGEAVTVSAVCRQADPESARAVAKTHEEGEPMTVELIPKGITVADAMERVARALQREHGLEPLPRHVIQKAVVAQLRVLGIPTPESSVMPSDHCYNLYNRGIEGKDDPMFLFTHRGHYVFVGRDYAYTGPVLHRPEGSEQGKFEIAGYRVAGKLTTLRKIEDGAA